MKVEKVAPDRVEDVTSHKSKKQDLVSQKSAASRKSKKSNANGSSG